MTETFALIPEPPRAGSEIDTLIGALDRNRRTFAWKCGDLDAAAMSARIGKSAITLGGLVRHLTRCEASSFAWKLFDEDVPLTESDWGHDWEWTAESNVEHAWQQWKAAVTRSQEQVRKALADGGLDREKGHAFPGWGGAPSLRRLLTDMIEEYARHTGHADLIREVVDGRVGEDVPTEWFLP